MTGHGMATELVVEINGLSRRFGSKKALVDVTLSIPRGGVFGLVGENGAGKTTLIRHILGLYRAQTGTVRVFGRDPVADPPGVLGRIGYLSEERDMPDWMRVRELIRYTRAFHPRWDDSLASELLGMFKLDPEARIHSLSRGQRAKAGLLAALAHRPDFLVLDEPSAGLDPAVRRHILWAVVRTAADEGRTVLFSSHLLDEVERVADNVAMLHDGTVAMSGPIDGIRERHRQFTLHFETPVDHAPAVDGALSCWGHGKEWNVVCDGESEPVRQAAARLGARVVEECAPSLEDIFIARTQPGLFAASGKEA